MLRRSLSSEAAASLITAFTWATSATGSFGPGSNHTDASALPLRSRARSRMMTEDSMPAPSAALASVLAINIFACSTACAGRSAALTRARNPANSPATVMRKRLPSDRGGEERKSSRLYGRDKPHVVLPDVVHPVADRSDRHRAGIGDQQPFCRSIGRSEPALIIRGPNDRRHPIVHLADQFVRSGRDDRKCLDRFSRL